LAAAAVVFAAQPVGAAPSALFPAPAETTSRTASVQFSGELAVSWNGYRDARLERAVQRLVDRLRQRSGLVAQVPATTPPLGLTINCGGNDPAWLALDSDEKYELSIANGNVILSARTDTAVLRGLATLALMADPAGNNLRFTEGQIRDQPRYAWRGVLIDVARHFISLATLRRQIDAMELVKLNVLHLHVSDNEGFRVESHRFPRLASPDHYSQAEVRDLIEYAADRGIRIVPEFDVPGHTRSWIAAFPDLAPPRSKPIEGFMNNVTIDPTRPKVVGFVTRLFEEMGELL
jgi:hexosaminidase